MIFFVSVAVEKTVFYFDKLYIYRVDETLVSKIKVGCFVAIPFGKSNVLKQAIVVKFFQKVKTEFNSKLAQGVEIKFIDRVLSTEPLINSELLKIVEFLHETCFCTWFSAFKAVLPSGLFFKKQVLWNFNFVSGSCLSEPENDLAKFLQNFKEKSNRTDLSKKISELFLDKSVKNVAVLLKNKGLIFKTEQFKRKVCLKHYEHVIVTNSNFSNLSLTKKQALLFNFIKEFGPVNVKEACYKCGVSSFVLKKLKLMNLIEFCSSTEGSNIFCNNKKQKKSGMSVFLTTEQKNVFDGLKKLLESKKSCTALLRGVTGSGKTQIFLKLIDFVIKNGRQVILLVPEIVLTSQVVNFFYDSFGNEIAVLNSSLTPVQQLIEFEKISKGVAKLVIGTRSAVFAPCKNLGLIIMDEEGVLTYKNNENGPLYHARDVAKFRCLNSKALLLLASATPSIETQYCAKTGHYVEFVLNKRFGKAVLPKVFIVDLKKSAQSPIEGVSLPFYVELVKNLNEKEQSIVLLNRRGHSSSVTCSVCGFKVNCPNCSAFLTYHSVNKSLICHYCGYICSRVNVCKNCSSSKLLYFGQGTQKIEDDFCKHFSDVRILRLDSDSTFSRVDLVKKIENFAQGNYDILIGTQIVAKGLNFLNVTLVGVIAIDNMLYSSDFRSCEQMFSLLTQVVGRSGRGEKAGRAFIQTYNPENATILKAASQNYESFYQDEILMRKQFLCPPFCDLCVVHFSGFNQKRTLQCAKNFILECRRLASFNVPIKVLGISTPFIEKLNRRYRNRVIIKCKNGVNFRGWIRKVALKVFSLKSYSGVRVNIDMNGEIL